MQATRLSNLEKHFETRVMSKVDEKLSELQKALTDLDLKVCLAF